jgi:hypothetical protein
MIDFTRGIEAEIRIHGMQRDTENLLEIDDIEELGR